jgi:pimeloyl-ACP methyl ester carboxylesterase
MSSLRAHKSTTVRASAWAIRRAAIRSVHPLAPAWATQLAARWFVTPDRAISVRATSGGAETAEIDPGEALVLEGSAGRLAARSWGRGPLVLLVHGWNGRGAQLAAVGRSLAERGFRAVAFDHPAHGGSSGRTVTIAGMASAIRDVSAQLGAAEAVVAHSLGAVAAVLALSRGLRADRAVLVAPPVDPERWVHRFGRAIGLPSSAGRDLAAAIEDRAGMPVRAARPLELAANLATQVLVIHDRADREVPVADGEALAAAFPSGRFLATEGLGHRRVLSSPAALDAIAEHLGQGRPGAVARRPRRTWGVRDPHLAAILDQIDVD